MKHLDFFAILLGAAIGFLIGWFVPGKILLIGFGAAVLLPLIFGGIRWLFYRRE